MYPETPAAVQQQQQSWSRYECCGHRQCPRCAASCGALSTPLPVNEFPRAGFSNSSVLPRMASVSVDSPVRRLLSVVFVPPLPPFASTFLYPRRNCCSLLERQRRRPKPVGLYVLRTARGRSFFPTSHHTSPCFSGDEVTGRGWLSKSHTCEPLLVSSDSAPCAPRHLVWILSHELSSRTGQRKVIRMILSRNLGDDGL